MTKAIKNSWKQKLQHERYAQKIRNTDIDIVKANRWLKIIEPKG